MESWRNLGTLINNSCDINADRQAIIDLKYSFTYSQIKEQAFDLCYVLQSHNITPNEPIGVIISNQGWDLINYFAIWNLQGVVVPIHENQSSRSIQAIIQQTKLRIIIKSKDGFWPEGIFNEGEKYSDIIVVIKETYPPKRQILKGAALIVFTSGSTGKAKGVVLSHIAFASKLETIKQALPFNKNIISLLVLQLTFSFGIWVSLLTLACGGLLIMGKKFSPVTVNNLILKYSVNTIAVVPTMLRSYLEFLNTSLGHKQLRILQEQKLPNLLITGGECLAVQTGRALRKLMPYTNITDVYGLTETSTSDFILLPHEYDNFPGTIGTPSNAAIKYRIVDDLGLIVSDYQIGELEISSPFIMNGYLDQPELTQKSFHDNYFRTGDLARQVKDSQIVEIVGRKKELIYKGGNKISPIEIESVFNEHPDIACSLVISAKDELMGERIHIFIICKNGIELSEERLHTWIQGKIDKYKYPDKYHFISSLPLGSTGKISRSSLKELLLTV